MKKSIKIATRKSPLALWQAEHFAEVLRQHQPGLQIELIGLSTTGDKFLNQPLVEIGGKGLFLKELEEAILDGRADLAVHSLKDVPYQLPTDLSLTTILPREESRDALVGAYPSIEALPEGAVVGTASLRRGRQLMAMRPDCVIKTVRGNVQTRLSKLDSGDYDALILAAVGLQRLELHNRIASILPKEHFLPAVGQGVIAVESRTEDKALHDLIAGLHCEQTSTCITAERTMNQKLGGSCHAPIAGHAVISNNKLVLTGWAGDQTNQRSVQVQQSGPITAAAQLGETVAKQMLAEGAAEFLK